MKVIGSFCFWAFLIRWEHVHGFIPSSDRRTTTTTASAAVRLATTRSTTSGSGGCRSRLNISTSSVPNDHDDHDHDDDDEKKNRRDAKLKPDILVPFAPAADPDYMNVGPVGEGDFIVRRAGGPTAEELSNENVRKIVDVECTDLEVNTLIWKCLGYRYDVSSRSWKNDDVFPHWREKYPTPPDLIGMRRIYEREIDQPVLRANQSLVRSVPVESKLSLKTHLKPLGWKGYQYSELTPNKTRRAQCANWIVFFREELFGYTVEELRVRRERKNAQRQQQEAEEAEEAKQSGEPKKDTWKPPVREVY